MARRRRQHPRDTIQWKPEEWQRRQSEEYEARRRRRANERQGRVWGWLIVIGAFVLAYLTGSAIPIVLLMLLAAFGVVKSGFEGAKDWLSGR